MVISMSSILANLIQDTKTVKINGVTVHYVPLDDICREVLATSTGTKTTTSVAILTMYKSGLVSTKRLMI